MVRQTSRWGQIFLLSLVSLGATAFVTAWFYRIDEVITVQGRLVPQEGGVVVKSPANERLAKVMVENGEKVEKGKVLLKFDVKNAELELETLKQQITLEGTRVNDQLRSNEQRKKTVKRNVELNSAILEKLIPLLEVGAISQLQILQQKNKIESEKDQLNQIKNRQNEIKNESKARMADLIGKKNKLDNFLKYELIKAPIAGTVFDLKPDNDEYVAQNAEPLLKIVPGGNLGGEVNIGNQDIGFVKPGQKVRVRVDSFPFTRYGELEGTISKLGADALPPTQLIQTYHFPVDIKLKESKLKTKEGVVIPLQAGMTISANLKLRDRRLIELLSDLFTNRSESLQRLRQP